jgi:hypothetical protein
VSVVHRVLGGFVIIVAFTSLASAQVIVDDKPAPFTPPAGLFTSGNQPSLGSAPDAARLIRATLGRPDSYGPGVVDKLESSDFYVILHLLKWAEPVTDAAGKTTQSVQAQNWYVYRGGEGWHAVDFSKNNRLFGANGFYLLVVHLNHSEDLPYRLNYVITIARKQAANVTHLIEAAKLGGVDLGPKAQALPAKEQLWAGRFIHVDDVPSDITVKPTIVAVAGAGSSSNGHTAAPPQIPPLAGSNNVSGLPAPGPAAAGNENKPAANQSAEEKLKAKDEELKKKDDQLKELNRQFEELQKKLDEKKKAAEPVTQSLGDDRKFDNEGNYWWDVSIGVPVRKVSEFTRTESGLDVKTASKATAFALLNIFFKPVDVKTAGLHSLPHALFGVSFEKRPLDRFFVGGGWGPVYANFFAGVAFKRVDANGRKTYPHDVTFGINVPVASIAKRLSGGK